MNDRIQRNENDENFVDFMNSNPPPLHPECSRGLIPKQRISVINLPPGDLNSPPPSYDSIFERSPTSSHTVTTREGVIGDTSISYTPGNLQDTSIILSPETLSQNLSNSFQEYEASEENFGCARYKSTLTTLLCSLMCIVICLGVLFPSFIAIGLVFYENYHETEGSQ